MVQTLRLTSLGQLKAEDSVNLERAARVDGRLGGHIVQGHVDGVAKVHAIEPGERWQRFVVELPKALTRYIVNQGSITLDGVSLTVGEIDDEFRLVTVWLIPETLSKTNLATKKKSDLVNVEVDVLAKYVERLISHREAEDK
jgi:riboflavin synthase